MDCLPSRYSFTQDDETKIQKDFFLIHSCWNTSTPLEKLKKKKKARKKRKRKEKLSPMIS